jgi:hypothetical protein
MDKTAAGNLACRILELERTLGAYRRLHAEELDELERCLAECKREILALIAQEIGREPIREPEEEFSQRAGSPPPVPPPAPRPSSVQPEGERGGQGGAGQPNQA